MYSFIAHGALATTWDMRRRTHVPNGGCGAGTNGLVSRQRRTLHYTQEGTHHARPNRMEPAPGYLESKPPTTEPPLPGSRPDRAMQHRSTETRRPARTTHRRCPLTQSHPTPRVAKPDSHDLPGQHFESLDEAELLLPASRLAQETAACTVEFDDRSGCGLNVSRRENGGNTFVGLTFVTRRAARVSHDISVAQAEQLRAVLETMVTSDERS
jgi:hypothetical protein